MTTGGNEERLREYLNRVTAQLRETRGRVRELEEQRVEPIAIVAMSCRFPGGADSPERFWELIAAGADLVGELPADRGWDLDGLYHPDPDHPHTTYTRRGAFLRDADRFDAGFFGISPREATAMDPQQRLLQETSWEVFERARIDVESLRGEQVGVFVGASNQGYGTSVHTPPEEVEGHLLTGGSNAVLSGRISYTLGFEGPAVTVDTMCSSSLVAMHLAVQALRGGECEMALAAGAAVMSVPRNFTEFSRQSGLSVDGRCKAFADGADGTGWGEGIGVLLLERLSDARRNGHRVLAIVRGSAVNQDGASNGLTAPNGPSQQRVIRAALANAGLSPSDIDAVEAHGTGTKLGDPIEAQALLATYGQARPNGEPLWLGSVKTNIGHTQAAAGVAGVMKMVLAMQHGVLPRTLHAETPSSHVDWTSGAVELLTEPREWPRSERPRRAGVSAFGGSGTNAHLIVEEPPEPQPDPAASQPDDDELASAENEAVEGSPIPAVPWPISARSAAALRGQASALSAIANTADPADIGLSLASTRSAFEYRAVILADHASGLAALAAGEPAGNVVSGMVGDPGRVVFVFPGQGAQWSGMAVELLETSSVFASSLAECETSLSQFVDWSLTDVLRGVEGAPSLDRVDVVQPVSFAVMVALAALWRSFGVEPSAVVGHSQGEIAAACVAGVLSLTDAARVVVARSRLVAGLGGGGAMVSVSAPLEQVESVLADIADIADAAGAAGVADVVGVGGVAGVSAAAVNAPGQVVLCGDADVVDRAFVALESAGARVRRIAVDYASHSPQMDQLRDALLAELAAVTPQPGSVPVFSTVTADVVDPLSMDAGYWFRNLREPVRFADAVAGLLDGGHGTFVEVSSHPVLVSAVTQCAESAEVDVVAVGSLRREDGGMDRFLSGVAELWVHGTPVAWSRVFEGAGASTVDLPTYAFQRERYWLESAAEDDSDSSRTPDPIDDAFWATVRDGAGALAEALHLPQDAPLSALPPALDGWRERQRDQSVLDTWRYRVDWVPASDAAVAPKPSGHWLVVTSEAQADDDTVSAVRVSLGEHDIEFTELSLSPDTDRLLLGELLAEHPGASGVVSLLALDEAAHPAHPAISTGLALNMLLAQALAESETPAKLWLGTQDAVSAADDDRVTHPVQASTWGLGFVVGLEHPDRWGGLFDLPPSADARDVARLVAAIHGDDGEDQLAIRAGGTLLRRLRRELSQPSNVTWSAASAWRTSGTALITGGTGGLGAHTARWLAQAGVEHLVLTSRRGADAPGARELADELAALGPRVTIAACDVTDYADLERLVREIESQGPPIKTVVHSAGVGLLAPLAETDLDEFTAGAHVKLSGTANLDRLFDRADLDAFVLYSSVAAVWGAADHAAYSAGNAYLHAVARSRRARGLAGTAIAWGIWSTEGGAGMANDVVATQLKWRGIPFMSPRIAVAGLAQAVGAGEEFAAIGDIDWERFVPVFTAARPRPLLDDVPEVRAILDRDARPEDGAASSAEASLRDRLLPLSVPDREAALLDLVRGHVAAVLGHQTSHTLEDTRPFRDIGFDSLLAVALRNALNAATGLRLATTVVFDHPSIAKIAKHVGTVLFGDSAAAKHAAAPPPIVVRTPDADDDAIAIIGMGCRFPGDVSAPEDMWRLLADGRDAVGGFPGGRGWSLDELYSPDPDEEGRSYVRTGGFVHDAGHFDAGFFGISPREAVAMDPQQRLLLETSWEAIERGRIDPRALHGSSCGVFVGAAHSGYGSGLRELPDGVEGHLVTGTVTSIASGRIAYTLGLEGPAVTLDTGCSSGLVALHLAVRSLRSGECELALAGAASVITSPIGFLGFSRQRGLATDGRCKAFSDDADGMGLAEGAGMVLLERLSDARRNGHRVLAVVRGSAVNQDGASNGLTAPNGPSQQRVIQAALADARLTASDVDAVEAHGTGTSLGDPIEAQALFATYGQAHDEDRPLLLGSIKSNIGHTQAAAGVAGLIKMVQAMRHGVLPRTLHAETPSSHVDWTSGTVKLLADATQWPETGRARRAGVSAFGVSGTNAHVILEQAPEPAADEADGDAGRPTPSAVPWLITARSAAALASQASALSVAADTADPVDAGWSLLSSRSMFEHRAVVLGDHASGLAALATGEPAENVVSGVVGETGRVVFVFPGQGAQWAGMAVELLETSPVFASSLAECEAALSLFVDWSLTDVLRGVSGAPSLDRVDVVQPVSFAVMVALAGLWRSFGVEPSAVVGHSQGEIAAACVAGVLSLVDAARVVVARSRLVAGLGGGGAMVSVAAPLAQVESVLAGIAHVSGMADVAGAADVVGVGGVAGVSVAAVNAPGQVVLCGGADVMERVVAACESAGLRARRIAVDYASHSPQMDQLRDALLAELAPVTPNAGKVPVFSTVTGAFVDPLSMDAGYWFRNLREPVRFADAVGALAGAGHGVFVECSSHPVLVSAVGECAPDAAAVGSLRRGDGGLGRFLAGAAELWVRGVPVAWARAYEGVEARIVDLPTYAFQREHYWLEDAAVEDSRAQDSIDDAFWAAVERLDVAGLSDTLGTDASPLDPVLPALSAWRREQKQGSVADSWRYAVSWQPIARPAASRFDGQRWLLLTQDVDEDADVSLEWTDGVRRVLESRGAEVVRVEVPVTDCDRSRLAERLRHVGAGQVAGVVSLLAFGGGSADGGSALGGGADGGSAHGGGADGGSAGQEAAFNQTAAVVQALGDAGIEAPLWLLTRGAVSIGPSDPIVEPEPALLWGLGRIAALEYPQRIGGIVDLPAVVDERAAELLGAAFGGLDGENQVAIRSAGAYVRRLLRAPVPEASAAKRWRPRGTVLITGGTGGLGAQVADWLVENAERAEELHLLLVSRRGLDAPGAAEVAERLRALGATATVAACDVADRAATERLLASVPAEYPLTAVVHAAAVLDDCLIDALTPDRARTVLRAKMDAARNLHELTLDVPLSAFVFFSSLAGTLGGVGQAAYAAANAYLDALAAARRASGLPATSLAWGAWAGDGLAGGEVGERLRRTGMRQMEPQTALRALQRAVDDRDRGPACVAVADVDWPLFAATCTTDRSRGVLSELPELRTGQRDGDGAGSGGGAGQGAQMLRTIGGFADTLAGRTPAEQERAVLDLVRAQAAAVLGLPGPDAVDSDRALRDLGFDSLTAVDLRNRLNTGTGLRLPVTVVFDHSTATRLARHLTAELVGGQPSEAVDVRAAAAVAAASSRAANAAPADDPIAIVAMGCRFPGGIETPEQLWDLLAAGGDAVSDFPADRGWDLARLYHPDPDHAGTFYTTGGGFLRGADLFDPMFFGIAPQAAPAIDPQHRLLLETAWEAFERAGIDPDAIKGSPVGVFIGANYNDYGSRLGHAPGRYEGQLATGSAFSVASGRVAYTFGLEGPAVTVDTACSSSLVALHLAAQSLRSGECEMALAGGVTVISTPDTFVEFSRQRALSADGRCKAFSADADGAGWAEGVGLLLVERLSDARRRGHPVLGIIRGAAVNQDGASNGMTAPNGLAQQRVIRQALDNAGLRPSEVDMVEAHGTGTKLGDPIEAQALLAVYGQGRPADRPLWLGTVKSNLGHTQAASGVAGVIKTVLALRNGTMPRTLHAEQPSPHVDWSDGTVRLLTEERAWVQDGEGAPRRAGVSSFGVSGTNVHVIIEEVVEGAEASASASAPEGVGGPGERSHLAVAGASEVVGDVLPIPATRALPWVLSARSRPALVAQVRNLLAAVGASGPGPEEELDLGGGHAAVIGRTLAARSRLSHRAVFWGADRDALVRQLADWIEDDRSALPSAEGVAGTGRTAYLFTGQGAQRSGMGRELYGAFPAYADAFDSVCAHMDVHLSRPLRDVVFAAEDDPDAALLDRTEFTQPAIFALEVALFRLLGSWGLAPDYLIGHSIGELAAAHLAGVFTLADACRVVAARGRLMQEVPQTGAMAAVAATELEVLPLLDGRADRIAIAAVNGPDAVVVSGDEAEVDRVAGHFADLGRKTRRLRVERAFHSPHMDAMLERFGEVVRGVTLSPPTLSVVSNVTGEAARAEQLCDPEYWVAQVRRPVRFADGVRFLAGEGVTRFVEVGPDATLAGMAAQCLPEDSAAMTAPALRRGRDEVETALSAATRLYVDGAPCDWSAFLPGSGLVDLPTYPFQRQRYWLDAPAAAGDVRSAGLDPARHPLLGAAVRLAGDDGHLFTAALSARRHPWLADHSIGTVVLPGTAFLDLALSAGEQVGYPRIGELTLEAPLVLAEDREVQVQLRVGTPDETGGRPVGVYARTAVDDALDTSSDEPWQRHASGTLLPHDLGGAPAPLPGDADTADWLPGDAVPLDLDDFYPRLAANGAQYGPAFQGLRAVWRRGSEVFAEVELPEAADAAGFGIHPALLDAALHTIAFSAAGDSGQALMPFSWSGVELHAVGATALRVRLEAAGENIVSVRAWDQAGRPVVSVESLAVRPAAPAPLPVGAVHRDSLFRTEWPAAAAAPLPLPVGRTWALIESGEARPELAKTLGAAASLDVYPTLGALSAAIAAGAAVPDQVVVADQAVIGEPAVTGKPGRAARTAVFRALEAVQSWLADERFAASRLVFVTRGAVAAGSDTDVADLPSATVWGLVRAANTEHPGRFTLIDVDGSGEALTRLPSAIALGEPQAAVRGGEVRVARLARVAAGGGDAGGATSQVWDADGTTLVTGATGTLGRLIARHLVTAHGVGRLLLISRRGHAADGAQQLHDELTALGAHVTLAACDAADREALARLLADLPAEHPLTGVVHVAGVVDDGVIASQTPERIDAVLAPKVDAALNLHELTRPLNPAAFVLFSSLAATFGGAGQAGYAAGNAFLDALASRRRADGLPALSLAWGPWAELSAMTGRLGAADHARIARGGVLPLSNEEGLALFDAACALDEAVLVPARLSLGVPVGAEPAPLLRGLVRGPVRSAAGANGAVSRNGSGRAATRLADRLAAMTAAERSRALAELVRAEAALVLAFDGPELVESERGFLDMGFDSLSAIELRNRLGKATGLPLPATVLFDHPTPAALVRHLGEIFPSDGERALAPILVELDRLGASLAGADLRAPAIDDDLRGQVELRLRDLLAQIAGPGRASATAAGSDAAATGAAADPDAVGRLATATDDEIFQFLDNQFDD